MERSISRVLSFVPVSLLPEARVLESWMPDCGSPASALRAIVQARSATSAVVRKRDMEILSQPKLFSIFALTVMQNWPFPDTVIGIMRKSDTRQRRNHNRTRITGENSK
jgi:hypothetical protein